MRVNTKALCTLAFIIAVTLPGEVLHAEPSSFFTKLLNSIKSIQAGEDLGPPEMSFTASGANVSVDGLLTLTWRSRYAASCIGEGAWQGAKALSGSEQITESELGAKRYTLRCSGDKGTTESAIEINVIAQDIDAYSGTKVPSYMPAPPTDFELFDNSDGLSITGGPEGFWHQATESPGAGKFIFIRVHQAARHGLEW